MSDPPYTLFVLDKSITNEVSTTGSTKHVSDTNNPQYLNSALERAYHGDSDSGWNFWFATNSYDDLPACPEVHNPSPDASGTEPPRPILLRLALARRDARRLRKVAAGDAAYRNYG